MKWAWVFVCVLAGTFGDLLSARGMAEHGEIQSFRLQGLASIVRFMATHKTVLAGIASNAVSFISLLALLSVAPLSFAVPATALSYIFKTILAKPMLGEHVTARRWMGVVLVSIGIALISF
ncbi:MAG: EamA family transporter [Bryobacteraceae bacterium]